MLVVNGLADQFSLSARAEVKDAVSPSSDSIVAPDPGTPLIRLSASEFTSSGLSVWNNGFEPAEQHVEIQRGFGVLHRDRRIVFSRVGANRRPLLQFEIAVAGEVLVPDERPHIGGQLIGVIDGETDLGLVVAGHLDALHATHLDARDPHLGNRMSGARRW